MSDNDLLAPAGPVDDSPLSLTQGDEAIANLIGGDLGTDLAAGQPEQKPDTPVDSGPDGDDDDGIVIGDDDIDGEGGDAPQEPEFKGGRFASDDAKVTLEDGSVISIAELKRNNLFQRDYSKKTEELAAQRKGVEDKDRQLAELSTAIENQRRFIDAWAKKNVPRPPDPQLLQTDPYKYMQDQAEYQQRVTEYNQFYQSVEQEHRTKATMSAEESGRRLEAEMTKLAEAIPLLKSPEKARQWAADTASMAEAVYGITGQELSQVVDHRFLRVLNDAAKWQRAVAKKGQGQAPAVQQQQRPAPRIPPQQRMSQQAPAQRDGSNALDRLRQTGSNRDAEQVIAKLFL
jgi:hypothetical protein